MTLPGSLLRCALRPVPALAVAALGGLGGAGCSSNVDRPHPEDLGRLVRSAPDQVGDLRFRPLSEQERALPPLPPPGPYVVGVGDVLNVQGLGDDFKGFGETRKGDIVGVKVKKDGKLYLPMIPPVEAAGRTELEVQAAVREELLKFKRDPYVSVDVLEIRSKRYFILGEVMEPGMSAADGETTLLEAVARAGGFSKQADVEAAYVLRQKQLLPVSLADIVRRGDLEQNLVLQDRDLIFVPSIKARRVYVLGEVKEAGAYPMDLEGMTLTQALAEAGGLDPVTANVNDVRVFRGGWGNPQCFTISALEAYKFGESIHLRSGDRVLVGPRGDATLARSLQLIGPVINTTLAVATAALAIESVAD